MRPYEFIHSEYLNLFYSHKLVEIDPGFKESRPTIFLNHAMGIGTLGNEYQGAGDGLKTMEKGFYESGLQIKNILRSSYHDVFYWGIGAGGMYRYGPYRLSDFEDNIAGMMNFGVSF